MSYDLRPYQLGSLDAVRTRKVDRGIVALPTGTGKSVVGAFLPEALGVSRVLYLAHRKELIDQLARHVGNVRGRENISIERAEERAFSFSDIVIASVPTLASRDAKRLRDLGSDRFEAVIVDESHHGTAESYLRIWRYLGVLNDDDSKPAKPRIPLIGLTATPGRGDGVGLCNVFDDIIYRYSLKDAIRDGWLVPLHPWTVKTDVSLDAVHTRGGDFVESELARAVRTEERNAAICDAHERHAKGLKTLVFCVDVAHAHEMAEHFERRGVRAQAAHGAMSQEDREHVLHWFATTPGAVLTNCEMITEGVDIPSIECVALARPTKSATLLCQMMGRGTRLADGARDYAESVVRGKASCIVLDVVDNVSRLGRRAVNIADIFGAPLPSAELAGKDILDVVEEQELALEKAQRERVATKSSMVDLFADPVVPDGCTMLWLDIGGELRLRVPDFGALRVSTDTLDRWTVERETEPRKWMQAAEPVATQAAALKAAEALARAAAPKAVVLLDMNAGWRAGQPSPKQLRACAEHAITLPDGANKGQVSTALDRHWRACRCPRAARSVRIAEWARANPKLAERASELSKVTTGARP